MSTITEVRNAIYNYIVEMNLNPYDMVITYIEDKGTYSHIIGQFQRGFLGDSYKFEAKYDGVKRSLLYFTILGKVQ